jgi:ketosteroid isomerase-like protein
MQASTELKDLVLRFYAALAQGDLAFVAQTMSAEDGAVFIGTDPQEWWMGQEASAAFQAQADAMGGGIPVVPGDPQAYVEGTVGWTSEQSKFQFPDGSEQPFRATHVFHQVDGAWKLVQAHYSIGVSNEEAVGQELPI